MIKNTHESIHGAVGRRVSFSLMGDTWENVLFSIIFNHIPLGSKKLLYIYL